jgi:hypothetical protein
MGLQVGGLSGGGSNVKIAGYASAFATSSGAFPNQREGEGSRSIGDAEFQSYWIDSKKGISGSPQWDSVTRRIVGVHAYDMWLLCAGGPRFGGRNASLARTIFGLGCSPQGLAGAQDEDEMDWDVLRELTLSDPEILVPIEELRVVDPFFEPTGEPDRMVFQVIENNHYEWHEYDVQGPLGETFQMVEMILPRQEWLSAMHAQALLSASRNWGVKYSQLPPQETWESFTYDEESVIELDNFEEDFPELEDDFEAAEWISIDSYEDEEVLGDIDGDGVVNGSDLAELLGDWSNANGSSSDLNLDGVVDGQDLAMLLGNWSN